MTLSLASPAFADGESIPDEYGYTARNVNPPLEIDDVPPAAESLVLLVDDPDAVEPAGKIWDHWVVWNVDPATRSIPEDWDPASTGGSVGENDYGEPGYGGPNPPDGEHTYRFALYALDTDLDLGPSASADDVRAVMEGHVLAETVLRGTYAP